MIKKSRIRLVILYFLLACPHAHAQSQEDTVAFILYGAEQGKKDPYGRVWSQLSNGVFEQQYNFEIDIVDKYIIKPLGEKCKYNVRKYHIQRPNTAKPYFVTADYEIDFTKIGDIRSISPESREYPLIGRALNGVFADVKVDIEPNFKCVWWVDEKTEKRNKGWCWDGRNRLESEASIEDGQRIPEALGYLRTNFCGLPKRVKAF